MEFATFKKSLEELALNDNVDLPSIQSFIGSFYDDGPIPGFTTPEKFLVRCSKNNPGEIFTNISRCSYNPNTINIPLQRCNYKEQQVFYCAIYSDTEFSTTSMTCLTETGWEYIEDFGISHCFFTLSRWQLKRPLKLLALPFSALGSIKNRDCKRIRNELEQEIIKQNSYPNKIIESLEYMSDIFCKRDNRKQYYHISSAFFNYIFNQRFVGGQYDGLVYSSANTEGSGMNVALRKELVDNKIIYGDLATIWVMQRNPNDNRHLITYPVSNDSLTSSNGGLHFIPKIY